MIVQLLLFILRTPQVQRIPSRNKRDKPVKFLIALSFLIRLLRSPRHIIQIGNSNLLTNNNKVNKSNEQQHQINQLSMLMQYQMHQQFLAISVQYIYFFPEVSCLVQLSVPQHGRGKVVNRLQVQTRYREDHICFRLVGQQLLCQPCSLPKLEMRNCQPVSHATCQRNIWFPGDVLVLCDIYYLMLNKHNK